MYFKNNSSSKYFKVNDIKLEPGEDASILGSCMCLSRTDKDGNALREYKSTIIYYDYYTRQMKIERQGEPKILVTNGFIDPSVYIQ